MHGFYTFQGYARYSKGTQGFVCHAQEHMMDLALATCTQVLKTWVAAERGDLAHEQRVRPVLFSIPFSIPFRMEQLVVIPQGRVDPICPLSFYKGGCIIPLWNGAIACTSTREGASIP